jgi:hypothetical protein
MVPKLWGEKKEVKEERGKVLHQESGVVKKKRKKKKEKNQTNEVSKRKKKKKERKKFERVNHKKSRWCRDGEERGGKRGALSSRWSRGGQESMVTLSWVSFFFFFPEKGITSRDFPFLLFLSFLGD